MAKPKVNLKLCHICGKDPMIGFTGLCERCTKPYIEGKADVAGRSLGVAIKFLDQAIEKKIDPKDAQAYLSSLKSKFEKLLNDVLSYDFRKVA